MGRAIKAIKAELKAVVAELVAEGRLREDQGCERWEITDAVWGDYCGSVWTRSNARVLAQSYAALGVEERYLGVFGAEAAVLPFSFANNLDWQADEDYFELMDLFARDLRGLEDYPILDESDMSDVEQDIIGEAWGSYLAADTTRQIMRNVADMIRETLTDGQWTDVEEAWENRAEDRLEVMEDELESLFWATAEDISSSGEVVIFESATDCCVIDFDKICKTLATNLINQTREAN